MMALLERIVLLVALATCVVRGDDGFLTEPHYIKECRIADRDFVNCSTHSIQQLFDKLNDGIPGLTSIKSFDPFYLNRIRITQGNSNAINLKVELANVKIIGFGHTNVLESQVFKKDYSWKTTFTLPEMKLQADYSLFGRILLIPLNGKGQVFLDAENMTVTMHTKTRIYSKGGFTFYNVTSLHVDFKMDGLKSYFSNLFNGNKQLEDSTNKFFNDNWRMLADALYTVITQTIEDILLDVLKKIFHFIPANFFVADIPTPEQLYGRAKPKPK
ncbi:circadian clock-controlled protein daywake isoform X1 [Drosophila subpulchrella]|uniref:circadian clock-controlled protein daywake isoform X1 n=1 Tax=Drosophila subpulchrella TaxID=1486046 RepID=UPI0018A1881E|nr:circadian clock-controlled protein daywake isoform X1 [Drosophila subpulchrella]